MRREPGTWDARLDYNKTYRRLVRYINSRPAGKRGRLQAAYAAVLLIQLRNGLRISEAVEAAKTFLQRGRREFKLRARKRNDYRPVVIPPEVTREILAPIVKIQNRRLVDRVKHFALNNFNFNTHSLRYAFITHLLEAGVSPALVAKITGHRRLDRLITYAQKREAEKILSAL